MTSIMDGLPAKISADSLHMQKGEEVPLGQEASPLRKVKVALGWSAPEQKDGYPVDIDASAFLVTREGRVKRDIDFIFYNNLELDNGAVKHLGDNTTGGGEGDDPGAVRAVVARWVEARPRPRARRRRRR